MNNIAKFRVARKLSQIELAGRIGVTVSTLDGIESGKKVSLKNALKLATFFKQDLNDLFSPADLLCSATFKDHMEDTR